MRQSTFGCLSPFQRADFVDPPGEQEDADIIAIPCIYQMYVERMNKASAYLADYAALIEHENVFVCADPGQGRRLCCDRGLSAIRTDRDGCRRIRCKGRGLDVH